MGAGAAKEIIPLVPMVLNALPVLIQGFQSTKSIGSNKENDQIAEVLEELQRDRQDIDRMLQSQEQMRRTYEGLTLLMNRLENVQGNQIGNGPNARGGPKIRIEMDLPENVEDQGEAVRNFWITLGRIGSAYGREEERRLADEPQDCVRIRHENLMLASAPPVNNNESVSEGAAANDKLNDFLSCGICTLEYNTEERRPTLLPLCGHTFCKECLCKSWKQKRRCPTCRKDCKEDVDQLPTNFCILDFMNEENDQDLKCKTQKKKSENVNDFSYDEQLKLAMQISLEENNDFLLAKRLQEDEDRLMRFRHNEDSSRKGSRGIEDGPQYRRRSCDSMESSLGDSCGETHDRERNVPLGINEDENRGARRKESSRDYSSSPKTFSDDDSDADCCDVTSRSPYSEARQMWNKLDEFEEDDCKESRSRFLRDDHHSEDTEVSSRNERIESDREEVSLYQIEKDNMMARAVKTNEEEKARRKQLKILRDQEELDLAIVLSMSMLEVQGSQDVCVASK